MVSQAHMTARHEHAMLTATGVLNARKNRKYTSSTTGALSPVFIEKKRRKNGEGQHQTSESRKHAEFPERLVEPLTKPQGDQSESDGKNGIRHGVGKMQGRGILRKTLNHGNVVKALADDDAGQNKKQKRVGIIYDSLASSVKHIIKYSDANILAVFYDKRNRKIRYPYEYES